MFKDYLTKADQFAIQDHVSNAANERTSILGFANQQSQLFRRQMIADVRARIDCLGKGVIHTNFQRF